MDLSVDTLLASLVVSSIGLGLFLYGKKQVRMPQLVVGLSMMVYPYFVTGAALMSGIAVVLLAGLIVAVRWGM